MRFYTTVEYYDQRLKAQVVAVSIYDTEEGDLVNLKNFSNIDDAIKWAEIQVNS